MLPDAAELLHRFGAGGRPGRADGRATGRWRSLAYLTDVLSRGDRLELRGPIGGYFVWDVALGGPLLLVAGGSGIVRLMAMLRHRAAALQTADVRHNVPARLLYSSRRWDDVIYRGELARLARDDATLEVALTFTREPPRGWTGFRRRIDPMMLAEVAWPPAERPHVFVCGPTPLVETAAKFSTACGNVGSGSVS